MIWVGLAFVALVAALAAVAFPNRMEIQARREAHLARRIDTCVSHHPSKGPE